MLKKDSNLISCLFNLTELFIKSYRIPKGALKKLNLLSSTSVIHLSAKLFYKLIIKSLKTELYYNGIR